MYFSIILNINITIDKNIIKYHRPICCYIDDSINTDEDYTYFNIEISTNSYSVCGGLRMKYITIVKGEEYLTDMYLYI